MPKMNPKAPLTLALVAISVLGAFAAPLAPSKAATLPPRAASAPLRPGAQATNVLVEALVGQIRKLNPLLALYNPVDRDITALIFEGLTTTNDYGEIVPQLARSWTVTADGLEYIFSLRDDVLWQDGVPFSAEDVVFTMRLMSDPEFPGPRVLYDFWRTVEVEALDAYTVRFRLTQPLASFPDQLRIGIVPKHALEGGRVADLARHPFNLSPIGTGPYQLEALTATNGQIDGAQLRVAPVYRQRPEGQEGFALERVVFRTYPDAQSALAAFQRGEVNSVGNIPPQLLEEARATPGLSLYTTIAPRVGVLIYNWERESVRFVRNPRARLALAHMIDRNALIQRHLHGMAVPADSPLLPTSWAYTPDTHWPSYDPTRAQALIETAQLVFEPPSEGMAQTQTPPEATATAPTQAEDTPPPPTETPTPPAPLSLTILTVDDPSLVALVEDVARSWAQLGFQTDVEAVDAPTLRARLEAGDFDVALVEFSFEPYADPDPYVFWHQGQYQVGQNFGGMDDRRISEALELARRDPVGVNRAAHYRTFQQLFAERAPALVLYYPLYIYGAEERLQGVQLGFLSTPSDRFRHIRDWAFGP